MDVSILQSVTEDLAGFLSEITQVDLGCSASTGTGTVGDLYIRLIEQNLQVAGVVSGTSGTHTSQRATVDRSSLLAPADIYGGGYDQEFRRTAAVMEAAFRSQTGTVPLQPNDSGDERTIAGLYAAVVGDIVNHTSELAASLGLDYQPDSLVTRCVREAAARL